MWNDFQKFAQSRSNDPFVTWLGEAGRIELSGATYMNAVSKAANLLVDGIECDEDSTMHVDLGHHWQSAVWNGAGLALGLEFTNDANIQVWNRHYGAGVEPKSEHSLYISRDPFGMKDRDVPAGIEDASQLVRGFGDHFSPRWTFDLDRTYIRNDGRSTSYRDFSSNARDCASDFGIVPEMRYALAGEFTAAERSFLQVVFPLLLKCSVVLVDRELNDEVHSALLAENATWIVTPDGGERL